MLTNFTCAAARCDVQGHHSGASAASCLREDPGVVGAQLHDGCVDEKRVRHHTVQKALIRGFADRDRVCMRRRGRSDDALVSVDDATVARHFYSYREDGEWRDDLEVWIAAEVESPMAPLLSQVRNGVPPATREEKLVTRRYVALCALRTPAARRLIKAIDAQISPLIALDEAVARGAISTEGMSDGEFGYWLRVAGEAYRDAVDRDISEGERQKSLLRTILRELDPLADRMADYHWTVRTGRNPFHPLLLGDRGVLVPQPGKGFMGLIPDGQSVFLPLSSDAVLVGSRRPAGTRLTAHAAAKINDLTLRTAESAVFTHPDRGWPTGFQFGPEAPALARGRISRSVAGPHPLVPERDTDPSDLVDLFARLGLDQKHPGRS